MEFFNEAQRECYTAVRTWVLRRGGASSARSIARQDLAHNQVSWVGWRK
jgi:hypothetical protein